MKVCLLGRMTNGTPLRGGEGSERYTINLYRKLIKQGLEIKFPYPRWTRYCSKPFHSVSGLILFDLLFSPVLLFSRPKVDIYHATFPQQGVSFPLIRNKNLVLTAHHVDYPLDYPGSLPLVVFRNYFQIAFKTAAKYSKHIIAVSEQTKQELISKFRIPSEKITVVHSGVDECFRPMEKKEKEVKTIGYLGSLTKRKNVDYLIQVFKILKGKYPKLKSQLEIYGTGPEYNNLLESAAQSKDITFKGFAPEDKIAEIYNTFDVFVFPSQHEGFGFPILEAQSCGIPVLTVREATIPREIRKNTIQCKNVVDMAEKIFLLLTDKSLYRKVSEDGLNYSKNFTWDDCAKRTIEVYDRITQS